MKIDEEMLLHEYDGHIPFASGGQGGSFRENRPPGPPTKAFH